MHGMHMFMYGDLLKESNESQQVDVNESPGNDCEIAGDIQTAEKVSDPLYLGKMLQTN